MDEEVERHVSILFSCSDSCLLCACKACLFALPDCCERIHIVRSNCPAISDADILFWAEQPGPASALGVARCWSPTPKTRRGNQWDSTAAAEIPSCPADLLLPAIFSMEKVGEGKVGLDRVSSSGAPLSPLLYSAATRGECSGRETSDMACVEHRQPCKRQ